MKTGVAVLRRAVVFTVQRKHTTSFRGAYWRRTASRLLSTSRRSSSSASKVSTSTPSDEKTIAGHTPSSASDEFSGINDDEFLEFGDIDDFEDASVFDGFGEGDNNLINDQRANERSAKLAPNLSQKMVSEFLNNIEYDVRYVPKYDVDIDDEEALTTDAARVEQEEIFVIDELGYETEAQHEKLEARIAKMTRVVTRELSRQGMAKAPEDLHALIREPPEFLHNARLKYTYHRYDQAQLTILDEHPGNHKVTLKVHVPHLDLDADQTAYLSVLAGNRYSKASRNLRLVCRKYLNRLLNKVHVRLLLDRLLAEARNAPEPVQPAPEEEEEGVPAWIAEDPYA